MNSACKIQKNMNFIASGFSVMDHYAYYHAQMTNKVQIKNKLDTSSDIKFHICKKISSKNFKVNMVKTLIFDSQTFPEKVYVTIVPMKSTLEAVKILCPSLLIRSALIPLTSTPFIWKTVPIMTVILITISRSVSLKNDREI